MGWNGSREAVTSWDPSNNHFGDFLKGIQESGLFGGLDWDACGVRQLAQAGPSGLLGKTFFKRDTWKLSNSSASTAEVAVAELEGGALLLALLESQVSKTSL